MSCSAACLALAPCLANSSRSFSKSIWLRSTVSPSAWSSPGACGADGLVDDPVQFLEHLGHVGRVAPLLQLLVDRLDVVVPLGIGQSARLHQQRLEADEHLPRHDLEAALGFVRGVDARPPRRAGPRCGRTRSRRAAGSASKPSPRRCVLGRLDGLEQRSQPVPRSARRCSPSPPSSVVAQGILRQRLAQALEHAVVVHDHAEVLARIHAVGAGDGLHQGVGLHRLVDVERGQALHVEAGQPHGADDGDAERDAAGP